jgi:hypothetical protein
MKNNISKELEIMEMEDRIHVIRQDLSGDALLSAKLVRAAFENHWEEVEKLLSEGADPRICRRGDVVGAESALYFAIKAERFDMAEKLYAAGDRLDDLFLEDNEKMPAAALDFLAFAMRNGDNYFFDESKNLPECCRCSAFVQIEKLMPQASREELNQSISPTVHEWMRMRNFRNVEPYSMILEDLLARGARLSDAEKQELLEDVGRRFGHCPKALHPGKEAVDKMVALIRQA